MHAEQHHIPPSECDVVVGGLLEVGSQPENLITARLKGDGVCEAEARDDLEDPVELVTEDLGALYHAKQDGDDRADAAEDEVQEDRRGLREGLLLEEEGGRIGEGGDGEGVEQEGEPDVGVEETEELHKPEHRHAGDQ